MPTHSPDLMEMILRECDQSGNEPWYPGDYAAATGVDLDSLNICLDKLRMSGLVELTEWQAGKGQGYRISPVGEEVVRSPRLMNELRKHGELPQRISASFSPSPRPGGNYQPQVMAMEQPASFGRSAAVRDALLTPIRPWATQLFLALNIINFLIGLSMGAQKGDMEAFLWGRDGEIMQQTGGFGGQGDLISGNSWRLFTCCFVHAGILHIGMNMYVLFSIGPMVERMFGSYRFAGLYLVAGLGGSITAAILRPNSGLVGASGAICGLIGAMLAWFLLNKSYLPQQMASSAIRNIMMNIFLIAAIGFFIPNVSNEGHFGGGLTGLIMAVPLVYNRFAQGSLRWLGLAGALIIPLLLVGVLQVAVAGMSGQANDNENQPAKKKQEPQTEDQRYREIHSMINATYKVAVEAYRQESSTFLSDLGRKKSIPKNVRNKTFAAISKVTAHIQKEVKSIKKQKQFEDPKRNRAIDLGKKMLTHWNDYFAQMEKCVDDQGRVLGDELMVLNIIMEQINNTRKEYLKSK